MKKKKRMKKTIDKSKKEKRKNREDTICRRTSKLTSKNISCIIFAT